METLHLSEKWEEVGGAAMDALELPWLPNGIQTGRLSSPITARGFYRKG
jgi:hypothetical protein